MDLPKTTLITKHYLSVHFAILYHFQAPKYVKYIKRNWHLNLTFYSPLDRSVVIDEVP